MLHAAEGVPEAMNEQWEQYTHERMLDVLARSRQRRLDTGVNELFAGVEVWCRPNGPLDDVTILGPQVAAR